ncbi:Glycosyl transferase family 2 [Roseateles sp. YR242]|uniref:glycosyltransferase family A protein n=1 Tax=Roseateles sp. YR242 TaxID=1855305 RepID=UPI0008BAC220|nr:glycosyltransferase family A protein [Roseateles sp. YR242]SEK57324.1 Glycosyl transferase family 2 [Roseateles sp. YR242]
MKPYSEAEYAAQASLVPVTICVPVYNGEPYLRECLDSIAAQTFRDFIVLVIDNASTDGTAALCASYDDARFFYLRNEINIGSGPNHNRALDLARSEFVKLFSADDVLFPDTLALQVSALQRHPNASLVTSDCIVTGPKLEPLKEARYLAGPLTGDEAVQSCVRLIDNKIGGPSNTLLRRSAVGAQRIDTSYKWLADLEFHCRVLTHGDYLNTGKPGFYYRRHSATDSEVGCPPDIRERDELAFIQQYARSPMPRLRFEARRLKRRFA